MKKSTKIFIGLAGLTFGAVLLTGCTKSFCTEKEKASMLYKIDPGITRYFADSTETFEYEEKDIDGVPYPVVLTATPVGNGFDSLYKISSLHLPEANKINSIQKSAESSGYYLGTEEYWAAIDLEVLERSFELYTSYAKEQHNIDPVAKADVTVEDAKIILGYYGYSKYCEEKNWDSWTEINTKLEIELGMEKCPSSDFMSFYKSQMNSSIANFKSCINTRSGEYGSYGQNNEPIYMEGKGFSYSWNKGFGWFIESILVYPIAWLVDFFANAFGYASMAATGVPQILSILVVTLIVRGLLILVSFKSTLSQQKMTQLQPEIAKIQAKYPNSDTNTAQKQRMSQETMALYKKHKINPLGQFLVLLIQFPIFIAVWGAMNGSAVLSTGQILGLRLSDSIGGVLMSSFLNGGFTANKNGWWTALVLILLMSAGQFFSMKLPQWLQNARNKKVSKMSKNPAQDKSNKTMKLVSNVMLIMIIVMGFSLPSAMGVYWFVGAIISILQTLIMQVVMNKPNKKKHK